jgi:hypothetical protein
VRRGDALEVVGRNDDACSWLHIASPDGVQGWVAGGARFINLRRPCASIHLESVVSSPSPTSTSISRLSPTPTAAQAAAEPAATSDCPADYRFQTSIYKWHTSARGSGELLIKNDLEDGLVILKTLDDQSVVDAFLRSGDIFTITGIPDGDYRLYFVEGSLDCNGLLTGRLQRFEDIFNFSPGISWEVTLYGVPGGNAGSDDLGPVQIQL